MLAMMDGWMNEWMNEWLNEWIDGWVGGCLAEWMDCGNGVANEWALRDDDDDDDDDDLPEPKETPKEEKAACLNW